MTRPPRDPEQAILSRRFLGRVAVYASLIATATLAGFLLALREGSTRKAVTIAFVTLGLAQGFHLGNARSRDSVLRRDQILGNPWALGALAAVVALQVVAVQVPPLARLLGLTHLSPGEWLGVSALSLLPAVAGQGARWLHGPVQALWARRRPANTR